MRGDANKPELTNSLSLPLSNLEIPRQANVF